MALPAADYVYMTSFQEGIATVGVGGTFNGKTILDKQGKSIIPKPNKNDKASGLAVVTPFNNGLAGATRYTDVEAKRPTVHVGIIDNTQPNQKGKEILDTKELPEAKMYLIIEASHKEGD